MREFFFPINILILFLIKFSRTQICGPREGPLILEDCFQFSDETNQCCFVTVQLNLRPDKQSVPNLDTSEKYSCVLIPKNHTFLEKYITAMDLGLQTNYTIDVKLNCSNYDQDLYNNIAKNYECGMINPKNISDCAPYTNDQGSCCYLNNDLGDNFCLRNPGKLEGNVQLFGYNFTCFGGMLSKISYFSLIFLLLMFI
jgi:hypothetical protein